MKLHQLLKITEKTDTKIKVQDIAGYGFNGFAYTSQELPSDYNILSLNNSFGEFLERNGFKLKEKSKPELKPEKKKCGKHKMRRVRCLDTGIEFNSIGEAASYYKIHYMMVSRICRGNRTTSLRNFEFIQEGEK